MFGRDNLPLTIPKTIKILKICVLSKSVLMQKHCYGHLSFNDEIDPLRDIVIDPVNIYFLCRG